VKTTKTTRMLRHRKRKLGTSTIKYCGHYYYCNNKQHLNCGRVGANGLARAIDNCIRKLALPPGRLRAW
jgi:hypothetical protein